MARPPYQPTAETRKQVESYAAVGVPHHTIAKLVGIDTKTLLKYYLDELDLGKDKANAQVAGVLFKQAIGGNTTAAIFWMKAQAGWRDRGSVDEDGTSMYDEGKKAARDRFAKTIHQGTEWDEILPKSVQ